VITLSATESQALTALRMFLLQTVCPAGCEVVQGQQNRVAIPPGPDWVVMTPILRVRLATNVDEYTNGNPDGIRAVAASTRLDVQCNFYGPRASDTVQIFTTLFRSEVGVNAFLPSGVAPLYTSEPRNMSFVNDSSQYESGWSADASLNFVPVVSVPQDFTQDVEVDVISVDATYPPT
jgi:hypothetical protein